MDIIKSPYEILPTGSLRFNSNTNKKVIHEETKPSSPVLDMTNKPKMNFVSRELDDESGKKILDYIYDEMNGSLIPDSKKKTKHTTKTRITDDGHKSSFYVPDSKSVPKNTSLNIFDHISDSLGLKTTSNIQKIDKNILKKNDITIRVLIEELEIPISNLRQANILHTFDDLLELGFTPFDLTRNRELFNCGTLKTLFNTDYKMMEKKNVPVNIDHIIRGKFYSTELQTINFSFNTMITEKGIGRSQLHALNFPLKELINLGFEYKHLRILDISKRRALAPQPEGFGWDIVTYDLLRLL